MGTCPAADDPGQLREDPNCQHLRSPANGGLHQDH